MKLKLLGCQPRNKEAAADPNLTQYRDGDDLQSFLVRFDQVCNLFLHWLRKNRQISSG